MEVNIYSNKTVLIIEDDFASKELLIEFLYDFDVNILTADSGHSAFEILKVNSVDLVLLDLKLPDTNRFAVIKEIRSLYGDKIKVIAQTANIYTKNNVYEEAGFDGYLIKPIDTREMKRLLVNLLSL